mgnify:CR=1 FL=1|tara:strand:+ start:16122 stop:16514 length:393 start_codon:yes stop_codon:yes gene_type:complete
MLKPSVLNIILFWFVKYILFYIVQMFKSGNHALVEFSKLKTSEDLYYYLWIFLFLPIVCLLIFTVPMFYSFRINKPLYFTLAIATIVLAEYILYTWLASQADPTNGIYNGLLTLLVFILFFYKRIRMIYQ